MCTDVQQCFTTYTTLQRSGQQMHHGVSFPQAACDTEAPFMASSSIAFSWRKRMTDLFKLHC